MTSTLPRTPRTILLAPLLLMLLLAGCRTTPTRTLPLDTTWDRGLLVGNANLQEPVAMLVEPEGAWTKLVWGTKQAGRIDLHAAQIDRERGLVVDADLETDLFLPRRYRLFSWPHGEARLLTLAKPGKGGVSGVFALRLSAHGELLAPPQRITPDDVLILSYDAVMPSAGVIELVWESRQPNGSSAIFRQRLRGLEGDAMVVGPPELLAAQGQGPSLFIDATGALHLLWHLDRELEGDRLIFYAPLGDPPAGMVEGVQIHRHGRHAGLRFSSPALTGDDTHLYAFWHLERLSGLGAGTASVTVISFPIDAPDQTHEFEIIIPEAIPGGDARPPNGDYIPLTTEPSPRRSGYVLDPSALRDASTHDRVILWMVAELAYRMKRELQPVMVVLQDGYQAGYAPIARSRFISSNPVGAQDTTGNLYAAWLDFRTTGRYLVLFSSTSEAWARGALRLTRGDMLDDMVGEIGFGLLAASALIPMLLFIFLLPMLMLGLLALTGRDRKLHTRTGRLQLLAAVILFYLVKIIAFAPTLTSPTLLRALPAAWSSALLLIIPLSIFLVSAGVLFIYIRRADNPGPITSFFLFALVDLILTAIIYAPGFY